MNRVIDSYTKNLLSTIAENCTINNFSCSVGLLVPIKLWILFAWNGETKSSRLRKPPLCYGVSKYGPQVQICLLHWKQYRYSVRSRDTSTPELELPPGLPERGWRKLTVFKKDFGGLSGPTLFLDLDIVIVGQLNVFFSQLGVFLIAHDKKNSQKREGNSSVFRFEIG